MTGSLSVITNERGGVIDDTLVGTLLGGISVVVLVYFWSQAEGEESWCLPKLI